MGEIHLKAHTIEGCGLAASLRRLNRAETEERGWLTTRHGPKLDSWRSSYLVDEFVTLHPTLCKGLEGRQRGCIDQRKDSNDPGSATERFGNVMNRARTGRFDRTAAVSVVFLSAT